MSKYGRYCKWHECKDGTVELPIIGGMNGETYTDLFGDEKELCVVEWGDEIPLLMNYDKIMKMFEEEDIYEYNNINDNCIEITFNGDVIYIICPLYAGKEITEHFENIKKDLKVIQNA